MNILANVLLHIVFYAISALAFLGVTSTMEKRKLQAQLWLSTNSENSLYQEITSWAQELGFSYGSIEYESMKENLLKRWIGGKKKAERTLKWPHLNKILDVGFIQFFVQLMLVIALVVAVVVFFDSLSMDFTQLRIAVRVLRIHS